jgi:anaerobic selenocysteine-containing dehydrogenase
VPSSPGRTAPEMLDAGLDVLISSGGNFLEVLPDPGHSRAALAAIPLRVHIDICLSSQMLVEPGPQEDGAVLLLPAQTRYEMIGGVTATSTERRVIFSPEIPGPRIPEAWPEWKITTELAARTKPEISGKILYTGTPQIRADIARSVPAYQGIETLKAKGDQFQYGGPLLCAGWTFPTPGGRAHFSTIALPPAHREDGTFVLATRRGKQFNSMVHEKRDALTGAAREAVLMNPLDADRLGLKDGDKVTLRRGGAELTCHVVRAPVTPGNLQVHWPEGLVLIDKDRRSPQAGIPHYNAVVTVE